MVTRIGLFEDSVRETQDWLVDVAERLRLSDAHYALRGLTAVLHALRDELSVNQNAALAAQMPAVLRGIYFQDWRPLSFEPKHSSLDAFLQRIDGAFGNYEAPPDPRELARQVFGVLEERIAGECRKIRRTLPANLRALWPSAGDEFDA